MLHIRNPNKECQRIMTGGRGNRGKYIDRSRNICAAGMPTAQGDIDFTANISEYLLKDEVDALISDAIIPPPPPREQLAPLRYPILPDQRNCGINSELTDLLHPPENTKFQDLVQDLKQTVYKSYWRTPLGRLPDPVPNFPIGHDIDNTTYGICTVSSESLYNLVMPKVPPPDNTNPSKEVAYQTCRKYCQPAFNPDLTFGQRSNIEKQGKLVKACLTDHRVGTGTSERIHINAIQADLPHRQELDLHNVNTKPTQSSDKRQVAEHPAACEINPKVMLIRECLGHLNTIRKVMSTRYLPTFFKKSYLNMKFYDQDKTEWLPKKIIYDYCTSKLIRIDPQLIEPLLSLWDAFDGDNINYKTFFQVINFQEPLPNLPKVPDIHPDCLDYRTTYTEMVKPGKIPDKRARAGVPSGRYLDLDFPVTPYNYCLADRINLPDETDMDSCLRPNIFTLFHVSHREMYAQREPSLVRKVFEGAGEKFTDESFNKVWEEAKNYHSQGLVCYETFRKALNKFSPPE